MKSSFAARRKARRIGQDEDVADGEQGGNAASDDEQEHTPVVKRPSKSLPGSSRLKNKSSLRLSFGPGEGGANGASVESADTFTPKKSNLSRQAMEKNTLRKSLAKSSVSDRLPIRAGDGGDRPSYSKDHIQELRSSTPSTPQITGTVPADMEIAPAIDVVVKFGHLEDSNQNALIPTEAEIKEKKQRRARLAHEQDFISLSDNDDGSNEVSLLPRKKKPESRLVRDDEDLGEGFDEFVEDGKISLGKKAEREQERRRRAEMQDMIEDAENGSDDESDDSEMARNAAYEAAQTRAGTYASSKEAKYRPIRPRTPPKISPLPSLTAVLGRLQTSLSHIESQRSQKARAMEELQREKSEIAAREVEIQALLKAAGEEYEKLTADAGFNTAVNGAFSSNVNRGGSDSLSHDRGLENFGDRSIPPASIA